MKLREKTGLKVYDIPHVDEFVPADVEFGDEHLYDIDPEQFVNLIRHADYVCTDSFHCSVFSILHHKKFIVFDRYTDKLMESRNSRIANLCAITGLEAKRFRSDIYTEISAEADFDNADRCIEKVKGESICYLQNALSD